MIGASDGNLPSVVELDGAERPSLVDIGLGLTEPGNSALHGALDTAGELGAEILLRMPASTPATTLSVPASTSWASTVTFFVGDSCASAGLFDVELTAILVVEVIGVV